MSKNVKRRTKVELLQRKWTRMSRIQDSDLRSSTLSFGRLFSKDPYDCGTPRCPICSYGKVFHPKAQRLMNRAEERTAIMELS